MFGRTEYTMRMVEFGTVMTRYSGVLCNSVANGECG